MTPKIIFYDEYSVKKKLNLIKQIKILIYQLNLLIIK